MTCTHCFCFSQLLSEHTKPVQNKERWHVLGQFSSIGSMGLDKTKWLAAEFQRTLTTLGKAGKSLASPETQMLLVSVSNSPRRAFWCGERSARIAAVPSLDCKQRGQMDITINAVAYSPTSLLIYQDKWALNCVSILIRLESRRDAGAHICVCLFLRVPQSCISVYNSSELWNLKFVDVPRV